MRKFCSHKPINIVLIDCVDFSTFSDFTFSPFVVFNALIVAMDSLSVLGLTTVSVTFSLGLVVVTSSTSTMGIGVEVVVDDGIGIVVSENANYV